MVINHNLSAIYAHRTLKFVHWEVDKNIEKLSSGYRINRAGDDASGLAVSEKMRSQIRGLRQAARNAEDGISFIQTAEGYLQESQDVMQRLRELSIQASNGVYTSEDRMQIQVEVSSLVDELDRIASVGQFNTMNILTGKFANPALGGQPTASMWFHIGPNQDQRERVFIGTMTAKGLGVRGNDNTIISLSTPEKANAAIAVLDNALVKVSKQRADMGAYQNRMEHATRGLMSAYENTQAAESRIRDVDMAEEMVGFVKNQILAQSGTAMLAQANLKTRTVLTLLGG
ncbi:MAG: flagellin [Spirochaetes bacterium]|nr:flagellin [Spirochaetota bacterium]